MDDIKKFTYEEAQEYIRSKGRKRMTFYFNVYGWNTYYTLEPTFATPTGNLKGFIPFSVIGYTEFTEEDDKITEGIRAKIH